MMSLHLLLVLVQVLLSHTAETGELRRNITSTRRGEKIRITTIVNEPFVMKTAATGDELTGNDRFEGYCVDLLKLLAQIVDFDYEIHLVRDGTYGRKSSDGSWSGMIGELLREEADVAIAPLTITMERERLIDFSKPFFSLGISVMVKKPEIQPLSFFLLLTNFDQIVWTSLVVAFLCLSLAVVICLCCRFKSTRVDCSHFLLLVILILTMMTVCLYIVAVFLTRSGGVQGQLINSVEELASQKDVKYGIVQGGATAAFFKGSSVATYRNMWQAMSANPSVFVSNYSEGVKRVRQSKGRYAFLLESTANDYMNMRRPCDTMKVGQLLNSAGYGIATPFGSDLRDPINLAVLELHERGELKRLENKWWYEKGACPRTVDFEKKYDQPLELRDLSVIFYILTIGITLAFIVSLMDFCCRCCRKN